ncbi:ABC transporter substrate-binding protein [candidate division WOR-3 bacterium]|nr:ABC transporter substrate-binding protein [candidate division WOR-3 bacterium]
MFKKLRWLRKIHISCAIFVIYTIFSNCYCDKPSVKPGFKIVSISPAMTEILFAVGAGNDIVGVTTFCNYPEAAKKIYKIGDFSNPSIERIVGLKPDIVIVNLPEQMRIKKQLEKLGVTIFVSSPKSLNDIYKEIADIGKIVKKERVADSLIHYMKMNIGPSEHKRKKGVYIELSPRPLVTIGAHSFLNEMLEMAGGKNIFSDLNKDYPVISQEEVIKRNPEIIILLHPGNITDRLAWKKIAAIKKDKVYTNLNQDHILRPGPRLVEGFKELQRIIRE